MLNYVSPPNYHRAFCALPFTKLLINANGCVSMCCYQKEQLGQLTEITDIMDIWHSTKARAIREATTKGELHSMCQSWNACPFLVKEKVPYEFEINKDFEYPSYLEICLPDRHCNVGGENPTDENPACIMCKRNFGVPNTPDKTELFCRKTRKLMPYLKHLMVLGTAEPFWKDALFTVLEQLEFKRYRRKICFVTNTNGLCCNSRSRKRFFEEILLSDVSWSLDAATPMVYRKIRRLDKFDLVIDNLKEWIKIRCELGSHRHRVVIYNNINMLNVHEMTMMVEMAHDLKVDALLMLPTHDQSGNVSLGELLLCQKNVDIFKEEADRAWRRSQDLGLKLVYPTRFDIVPPHPKQMVQLTVKKENTHHGRDSRHTD